MSHTEALSKIEDIIADAKAGRMFILVDDENRENEGDLVIPAEKATPEVINFMAKHGRGLICLAMDRERVEDLGIPLMAQHNGTRHQTAFTVSIEAREGVTTGISAADRAHTIQTAIDPAKTKYDIVSPGHIFPLVSRDGGVLVRAGHTEAAVDIARLAGLNPSGVICEIMSDDGTMARLPELIKFAGEHKIKIATIADLIEYRRKNEKLIERIAETELETDYAGNFKLVVYRSKLEYAEHIALVKGEWPESGSQNQGKKSSPATGYQTQDTILVRMHQLDVLSDILSAKQSPKSGSLKRSMEIINKAGKGVVVLLRSPDRQSLSRSVQQLAEAMGQKQGASDSKSVSKVGKHKKAPPPLTGEGQGEGESFRGSQTTNQPPATQIRDYGIGAQILLDLGVHKMNLLTNSGKSVIALDGYGLSIEEYTEIK